MKLRFVIPDPEAFQSGGNLYNFHLVKALEHNGVVIQVVDFEQFVSGKERGDSTVCFIDTLYFEALKQLDFELKNCFLIVHHLESLYPAGSHSDVVFEENEREFLNQFDGFLTSSEFTKEYLFEKELTQKHYIIVVPALCFQPNPVFEPGSILKAVIVANLIERKGIFPFLKCLQKSNIDPEKCQIQIAGSVTLEPEYAQKCLNLIASDSKLSKLVEFLGPCDSSQIQTLYEQSNLFISTSFMETFGMALQEAVAYRLPILAFDGGNAKYHIESGKNGFLFSSIQDLVDKLEILSNDDQDFKSLTKKAWKFRKYESYDWAKAADLFIEKLNQYVSDRF